MIHACLLHASLGLLNLVGPLSQPPGMIETMHDGFALRYGGPDSRVSAWWLWSSVPVELRPFFIWDELFGKPTVRHDVRNDYERAMIHQAVQWNNAQFMKAFESMESS